MPRVLAVIAALGLAVAVLANAGPVEAKPNSKPPHPHATPTPTPTPSPAYLAGIDVSYHQGTIDWGRVATAGKAFAFVRASAGTLTSDVAYETNRAGAHAAGIAVGAYHFGNPDSASE